jgi:uracil-DNA glycosylase family protein
MAMASKSALRASVLKACEAARAGRIETGDLPLPALAEAAGCCRACPLYKDTTQTVFGEGASHGLMLVGEQPGDEEDRQGRPFVGPAGRLLQQLLTQAGLQRNEIYLTNAVKHFSHVQQGSRRLHQKPKSFEVAACKPWLLGEITRAEPRVILALGATAAAALFGRTVSVTRDRGKRVPSPLAPICLVSFHPSAALRAPTSEDRARTRAALLEDLVAAKGHLGAVAPGAEMLTLSPR